MTNFAIILRLDVFKSTKNINKNEINCLTVWDFISNNCSQTAILGCQVCFFYFLFAFVTICISGDTTFTVSGQCFKEPNKVFLNSKKMTTKGHFAICKIFSSYNWFTLGQQTAHFMLTEHMARNKLASIWSEQSSNFLISQYIMNADVQRCCY